MNSRKSTSIFLKLLTWSLLSIPVIFTLLPAQSQGQFRKIAGLTQEDIQLILSLSPVPQYPNQKYDGPEIDPNSAYDKDFYKKEIISSQAETLKKRLESAISYRNKGDIDQFNSILIDVITSHNFNEEAAWAALLLGNFELILYNLGEAIKYYVYAVNVHYQSKFGIESAYQLAVALDRSANWKKAEELFLLVLDYPTGGNLIKNEAKEYISKRYLERVRWHYDRGEDDLVKEYFQKYQNLTGNKKDG